MVYFGPYDNPHNNTRMHQAEIAKLREEVSYLKEQVAWFQHQLFGQKSEKFVDNQKGQQLLLDGFGNLASQEAMVEKQRQLFFLSCKVAVALE
jgi:Transposase C of IS166 homeodomain